MGQNNSSGTIAENLIPNTIDLVQYELTKQIHALTEINDLSYDDFQKCLLELNELSKKCFQNSDSILVFAVKKSTDDSVIWKAMVRIACVKVEKATKRIESYKLLNLKQFIRVFKTFQSHLEAMDASQSQTKSRMLSPSALLDEMETVAQQTSPERNHQSTASLNFDILNECCICLDRKPEILLPCTHTYCCPCIEQWNVTKNTCPICQEKFDSTSESWVLTEIPDIQDVNEEIFSELQNLSKN